MNWKEARKIFLDNCPGYEGCEEYRTELGFFTHGGDLYISTNTACHAGLIYTDEVELIDGEGEDDFNQLEVIFSSIVNDLTPEEDIKQFADWLINRSPWAGCFLNHSAEDVVEFCWVLNPESPSKLLAGACMATRHPTEWPERLQAWKEMVNQGVDENKAYLLSHHIASLGDKDSPYPFMIDTKSEWHIPVYKHIDKNYFKRFVKNNPVEVGEPYVDVLRYSGVSEVWGRGGDWGCLNFEEIVPRGGRKEVKRKNLNIFFKPKKQGAGYKFTTPVELKNLAEDMEKMINAA